MGGHHATSSGFRPAAPARDGRHEQRLGPVRLAGADQPSIAVRRELRGPGRGRNALHERRGRAVGQREPQGRPQPHRGLAAGPLVQRRRTGQPDRRLLRSRPLVVSGRRRRRSPAAPAATPPTAATTTGPRTRGSSFGGDGSAHQIALAVSADQTISAILVSSSRDGGRTWGRITTLQRDTSAALFNDKESITADPRDGRFVYAVWDRLQIQNPANPASPFSGDTLFARSTDGGRTWERDADDPRLPRQQQHPDARQPDRRAERRDAGQHLRPDRPRAAARGRATLDRPRRDLVGPDHRRRAVQQRRPGSGRRRSVRPAPGADR